MDIFNEISIETLVNFSWNFIKILLNFNEILTNIDEISWKF